MPSHSIEKRQGHIEVNRKKKCVWNCFMFHMKWIYKNKSLRSGKEPKQTRNHSPHGPKTKTKQQKKMPKSIRTSIFSRLNQWMWSLWICTEHIKYFFIHCKPRTKEPTTKRRRLLLLVCYILFRAFGPACFSAPASVEIISYICFDWLFFLFPMDAYHVFVFRTHLFLCPSSVRHSVHQNIKISSSIVHMLCAW